MTTAAIEPGCEAASSGCKLPCDVPQEDASLKKKLTSCNHAEAHGPTNPAAERSRNCSLAPPRSASATPRSPTSKVNKTAKTDDGWMFVYCTICNTEYLKTDYPTLVCPQCRDPNDLMVHGRYNWVSPGGSGDEVGQDSTASD